MAEEKLTAGSIWGLQPLKQPLYVDVLTIFLVFDKDNNFVIDINGRKQPNMTGKDIFYFTIEANSNLQGENFITINPLNSNCPKEKSSCTTPVNCKGCAKRILEETGRIDYF